MDPLSRLLWNEVEVETRGRTKSLIELSLIPQTETLDDIKTFLALCFIIESSCRHSDDNLIQKGLRRRQSEIDRKTLADDECNLDFILLQFNGRRGVLEL